MPRSYSDQITVEKTPAYFITPEVPRLLHAMNPEVKLLLVVRDPVTRAISDYVQASTKRPLDAFETMALLDARLGLINTSWAAVKIGLYAKHLQVGSGSGVSTDVKFVIQIGSDWPQTGQIWDFL